MEVNTNNLNLLLPQLVEASVDVASGPFDGAQLEDGGLFVIVISPPAAAAVVSPLSQLLPLFLLAGYFSQVDIDAAVFL